LGEKTLPANIMHNLQVKYGLDQPMYVQFFNYLKNALVGDFGVSIKLQGRSVTELILMYFPVSMSIGLIAVAIAMVTGTVLGILSALKTGRTLDHTVMFIATLGTSIPSFVVGSVSVIIFGVMVRLLPTYGLDSPQSYILPAFALSFFPLSFVARLVRSTMLDVLKQDYIKTARAKGLSEGMVLLKHALKNAILPVVTYLGPLMASVVCGSFVIEKIFTIPGLGKSFVESINSRDYPVIMGTTIFYAAILIFMNFVVDILYVFVDPRIKNSN
jgi:oligopeptide transport system permease protein